MEVCSPRQRSVVGPLYQIPWSLGYMLVPLIAYMVQSWRWLQAAYSLPLLYTIILFWLVYMVWFSVGDILNLHLHSLTLFIPSPLNPHFLAQDNQFTRLLSLG